MKHTGKVVNNTDVATKEYVDSLASQYTTTAEMQALVDARANAAMTSYKEYLDEIYGQIASIATLYPIGAIYVTLSSTFDPNTTFTGTTWVQLEDWIYLTQKNDTSQGGVLYTWQRTA